MEVVHRSITPGEERIHLEITAAEMPGLIGDLALAETLAGRWLLRQLMAELAGHRAVRKYKQQRGETT